MVNLFSFTTLFPVTNAMVIIIQLFYKQNTCTTLIFYMVNIYFDLNCTFPNFILQNIISGLHIYDIGPENALSICYCNHLQETNCSRLMLFFITYIHSKTNQPVWRSHHIEFDLMLIFVQAYCSTIRLKQKWVFVLRYLCFYLRNNIN